MTIYFFRSIHSPYNGEFLMQNRMQNTRVMSVFSLIVLCIAICVRIFIIMPNYDGHIIRYQTHAEINLIFITVSVFFCPFLFWLNRYKMNTLSRVANDMSWLYSLVFVGGGIWVSFMANHNPSNTFTLVFLGLFTVAATTVFSLLQTFGIMVVCIAVYISGVLYFGVPPHVLPINIVLFVLILICYFAISSFSYSFHANNFIKLKTIEEKNRIIEAGDHSKNEILGIVAHDLRSPIANIRSLIELMQHEETTEEEKAIYFDHINTCCTKAELIVKDIITAAQEETQTGVLQREPVNLNTMLAETQRNFQRVMTTHQNIMLQLPNAEIILPIHREKFQRVLDNLLSNAIKFTDKNTGVIVLELINKKHQILINVKDNGIGIPAAQQPFVFDKFTQSGRIGLNAEPSVGLGLHISKQIIEKHNGTITLTSEENKGSTFCITLPVQQKKTIL